MPGTETKHEEIVPVRRLRGLARREPTQQDINFNFSKLPIGIQNSTLTFLTYQDISFFSQASTSTKLQVEKSVRDQNAAKNGHQLWHAYTNLKPINDKLTIKDKHFLYIALGKGILTVEQVVFLATKAMLSLILSSRGLFALQNKLISVEEIGKFRAKQALQIILSTEEGLLALEEKLFTLEQLAKFKSSSALNALKYLFSKRGLTALRQGLVTFVQMVNLNTTFDSYIDHLTKLLISPNGIIALHERLIRVDELIKATHVANYQPYNIRAVLEGLLTNEGLQLLREKFITLEKALTCKDTEILEALSSKSGLIALREKFITIEQAILFANEGYLECRLKYLLSNNGITALREELITTEQAYKLKSDLEYLLSDNGLFALRKKLLTIEQAFIIYQQREQKYPLQLKMLLSNNGLTILQAGFITTEQAIKLGDSFHPFTADNGLIALQERLITVEQASRINSSYTLDRLLSKNGLMALREKLITLEQVCYSGGFSHLLTLFPYTEDVSNGLTALREGLITFDQVTKFKTSEALNSLLMYGLNALRQGYIKPEDVNNCNSHKTAMNVISRKMGLTVNDTYRTQYSYSLRK